MKTVAQALSALLLRPSADSNPRQETGAEKNLRSTDAVVYCNDPSMRNLFIGFAAGACSMAVGMSIVITYSGSAVCN